MGWFDAVCHGFSALALGGFSTYDASIGHFNSLEIEMVLTVFPAAKAALNFATHYLAWSQRGLTAYLRDAEAKAILGVLATSCIGIAVFLFLKGNRYTKTSRLRCAMRRSTWCPSPPTAACTRRTFPAGRSSPRCGCCS